MAFPVIVVDYNGAVWSWTKQFLIGSSRNDFYFNLKCLELSKERHEVIKTSIKTKSQSRQHRR